MKLRCNTYQVLVLLNAGCYNFEALRVDERCRTPRHSEGQLEPISLDALLGGGGLGDKARPRHFLFPKVAVGNVMLITKIQFWPCGPRLVLPCQ
jgi:hypothetical protein